MVVKLVGAEHYRGQVDQTFAELRKGDTLKCSDEAGRELVEGFPGWFEAVDGNGERQAKPKRDRQVRGGRRNRG